MSRIPALTLEQMPEKSKELLSTYKTIPAMYAILANAPTVLEAYMGFSRGMAKSTISRQLREGIALLSAQTNGCQYCLSAHTQSGRGAGLSDEDMLMARQGHAPDPKTEAALQFAHKVLHNRAQISEDDLAGLRVLGFTDEELVEIVGAIMQNMFTNYFNLIAGTEVDTPKIDLALPARP